MTHLKQNRFPIQVTLLTQIAIETLLYGDTMQSDPGLPLRLLKVMPDVQLRSSRLSYFNLDLCATFTAELLPCLMRSCRSLHLRKLTNFLGSLASRPVDGAKQTWVSIPARAGGRCESKEF